MQFSRVHSAYTLVELVVVIAIIGILSLLVSAPYSYYQNIARVRNSADRIMQTFSDAKVAAASGLSFPGIEGNYDIGVVLEKNGRNIETVGILPGKNFLSSDTPRKIRTLSLEDGIAIAAFSGASNMPDKILLRYFSSSGTVKTYSLATDPESEISGFSGGMVSLHGKVDGPLALPFSLKAY